MEEVVSRLQVTVVFGGCDYQSITAGDMEQKRTKRSDTPWARGPTKSESIDPGYKTNNSTQPVTTSSESINPAQLGDMGRRILRGILNL